MAAFINFLGLTGVAIVRKALVRLRFEKIYRTHDSKKDGI
jgi:hypothetical protein